MTLPKLQGFKPLPKGFGLAFLALRWLHHPGARALPLLRGERVELPAGAGPLQLWTLGFRLRGASAAVEPGSLGVGRLVTGVFVAFCCWLMLVACR